MTPRGMDAPFCAGHRHNIAKSLLTHTGRILKSYPHTKLSHYLTLGTAQGNLCCFTFSGNWIFNSGGSPCFAVFRWTFSADFDTIGDNNRRDIL